MSKGNLNTIEKSQLVEFYRNKNVFITGSSGFLGKVLLEKLMRSCPEIGNVYLLFRECKGLTAEERLEKIFKNPIFDTVKKEIPEFWKKFVPMRGDVKYDGLGLGTKETELLINEINIVFHIAATVRFTEPLYEATNINVKGTKEVLDLCKKMNNINVVMVTSTAFSFAPLLEIKEAFVKPPVSPKALLELVEGMPIDTVNQIAPKLIGKWPNTYTFTKAVMEDIVRVNVPFLPIGMFRPPAVLSTIKEPIAGWTDNANGPNGMVVGIQAGFLHVCLGSRDISFEAIPVDLCINALLACTYDTYEKNKSKNWFDIYQTVYNCTLRNNVPIKTRDVWDKIGEFHDKYPFEKQMWAKAAFYTTYPVIFIILSIFLHFIPALLLDTACKLQRKKPIFTKLYYRVFKENIALSFFVLRDWNFSNNNLRIVWKKMNDADKKMFSFDLHTINIDEYAKNYVLGLKKYLLREKVDDKSIEQCRKKLKILNFLHCILSVVFFTMCLYIAWRISHYIRI